MAWVRIGNQYAIEVLPGGGGTHQLPGKLVTTLTVPEDRTPLEALTEVVSTMKRHIEAGKKPSWIESSSKSLRDLLITHYGLPATAIKEPDDWIKKEVAT